MELSSEEGGEIPIPINSTTYGGGHGNGHGHIIQQQDPIPPPPAPRPQNPSNGSSMEDHQGPYKKVAMIRYRECLKNHAASMGGNATDGCGEFMPSGQEGTIEALTCSACHCHRNFHRKEVEGDDHDQPYKRKFHLGYPTPPPGTILPSRTVPPPPHHMILPYNLMGPLPSDQSDHEQEGGGMVARQPLQLVKKRFRTKFTQEQKEKMLGFAEKVGWKIQKQEESVVQQFCQEIGIKRRVLKVWMHNNKHSLAKKDPPSTTTA